MKTFVIRTNCEYVLEIEADDEQEALRLAGETAIVDGSVWHQAWAPFELEEVKSDEDN